jgi:hypothetical protein
MAPKGKIKLNHIILEALHAALRVSACLLRPLPRFTRTRTRAVAVLPARTCRRAIIRSILGFYYVACSSSLLSWERRVPARACMHRLAHWRCPPVVGATGGGSLCTCVRACVCMREVGLIDLRRALAGGLIAWAYSCLCVCACGLPYGQTGGGLQCGAV